MAGSFEMQVEALDATSVSSSMTAYVTKYLAEAGGGTFPDVDAFVALSFLHFEAGQAALLRESLRGALAALRSSLAFRTVDNGSASPSEASSGEARDPAPLPVSGEERPPKPDWRAAHYARIQMLGITIRASHRADADAVVQQACDDARTGDPTRATRYDRCYGRSVWKRKLFRTVFTREFDGEVPPWVETRKNDKSRFLTPETRPKIKRRVSPRRSTAR